MFGFIEKLRGKNKEVFLVKYKECWNFKGKIRDEEYFSMEVINYLVLEWKVL